MTKTIFFLLLGALTVSLLFPSLAQAQSGSPPIGAAEKKRDALRESLATQCRCTVNFSVENITVCNVNNKTLTLPLNQLISVRNAVKQIIPNIACQAAVAVIESQFGTSESDEQVKLTEESCLGFSQSFSESVVIAGNVKGSVSCAATNSDGKVLKGGGGGGVDGDAGAGGNELVADLQNEIAQLNRLKTTDPAKLIGRIIKLVLQVVGSIALLVFVYGGIMWMTARGNAERTGKAIKTIVWGALGVAVILASYTLVEFIFGAVG